MQAHSLSNTGAWQQKLAAPPSALPPPATLPEIAAAASTGLLPAVPSLLPALPSLLPALPPDDPRALAHDAGNLLGALSLYCGLLEQPGVLQPQHLHYAQELTLLSERTSGLVARILQVGSMYRGPRRAVPMDGGCDPLRTLRCLLPVLRQVAGEAVDVSFVVAGSVPMLPFATDVLERLALNLVRNAITALSPENCADMRQRMALTDAAPAGERASIRLRLRRLLGAVLLEVEDNGPGMSPAACAAFLRPTPLPEGAVRGLGHRIVHELASVTGATLEIRVRPTRGTLVRLTWPAAQVHGVPGEAHRGQPRASHATLKTQS